jgi:hypothetical protein
LSYRLAAHEIGTSTCGWTNEPAFKLGDRNRLTELELLCDGIAIRDDDPANGQAIADDGEGPGVAGIPFEDQAAD